MATCNDNDDGDVEDAGIYDNGGSDAGGVSGKGDISCVDDEDNDGDISGVISDDNGDGHDGLLTKYGMLVIAGLEGDKSEVANINWSVGI